LEGFSVCDFAFSPIALNEPLKKPASPSLIEVDRISDVLRQDKLISIDLFRLFGTGSDPYGFRVVWRVMVIMIMRNNYRIGSGSTRSNS
jgi:hypothetical protein